MGRDDLGVDVLIADVGVELIRGAEGRELRERGQERDEARSRHTGGDAEHVLLGYADVEEPVREFLGEIAYLGGLGEVGGKRDDLGMSSAQFDERLTVYLGGREFSRLYSRISHSSCHDHSPSFSALATRFL